MEIMVIIAAIVAALLIGPAVAIGCAVDNRKSRSLAVLLRSRLEAAESRIGGLKRNLELMEDEAAALWFERAEAQQALVAKAEELRRAQAQARVAHGVAIERGERIAELKAEIAHLYTILSRDGVEIEALRNEVTSLRKQRRFLVGQRDALVASVRGLTADTEGASADANALRSANSALMSERAKTFKRLGAANSRVRALEAFINQAYGPVDECEIKDGDEVW